MFAMFAVTSTFRGIDKSEKPVSSAFWTDPAMTVCAPIHAEGQMVTHQLAHFLPKQSDCLPLSQPPIPPSLRMAPSLSTLLTFVLLISSPAASLASPPPASIGTLLCAGTLGFLLGTGAGMGLGYLVFGWRFRNSIGIWKGDQGFGIWGRRKRDAGVGKES